MRFHGMTTDYMLMEYAKQHHIRLGAVCMKDQLKDIHPYRNYGYIVNMQDSKHHGTHWTCIYIDPDWEVYYFDSFGIVPSKEIENWISRFNNKYTFQDKDVQNISSSGCGQYCLEFLRMMQHEEKGWIDDTNETHVFIPMSYDEKYKRFLHLFKDDDRKNLNILKRFIKL